MTTTYDEEKLAELVLYVADRMRDDRTGAATKLNKVLFFAEFAHMRQYGRPITGAEYQKLEFGPAPRRMLPVRQGLIDAGLASIEQQHYLGYPQQRLVPIRPVEVALLSPTELAVVDGVIADLRNLTARQVSDLSHEEEGWRMVDVGATIPYEAAYLRRPVLTDKIREHGRVLAEAHGRA